MEKSCDLSSILRKLLDKLAYVLYFYPPKDSFMKVSDKIKKNIARIPDGTPFTYQDLAIIPGEYPAATKAIERLIKNGAISRASTGVFYKPKNTPFGTLKPREEELLRPYLFENDKRVAYITGTALYNKLGLTTQVPKNIKVASRDRRIITTVGNIQVKPVKSYVDVTDDNYYIMELLDVLKDFKTIPDTDKSQTIRFVLKKIKALAGKERDQFIKIAIKYPPRVRAFAGALLSEINSKLPLQELKRSINPLSTFKFSISEKQLSKIKSWNIS